MEGWQIALMILLPIVFFIIGIVVGFFISKKIFNKQIEENPPINEDQIRSLYAQMGRKPSESQIRAVINNFKKKSKF